MFGIKLHFSRYGWTHFSFSNSRQGWKKQMRSPDAPLQESKITLRRHGVSLVCRWGFTIPLSVFTGCPKCPQRPKESYRDAKTITSEWPQHSYVCTQRQDAAPCYFFWQPIRRDAVSGGGRCWEGLNVEEGSWGARPREGRWKWLELFVCLRWLSQPPLPPPLEFICCLPSETPQKPLRWFAFSKPAVGYSCN